MVRAPAQDAPRGALCGVMGSSLIAAGSRGPHHNQGIGDCCYRVDMELYISMNEYTGDMGN